MTVPLPEIANTPEVASMQARLVDRQADQRISAYAKMLMLGCTMLLACGCGTNSAKDTGDSAAVPAEQRELVSKANTVNEFIGETSDAEVYQKATWYFGERMFSTAEKAFDALLTDFPDSSYTDAARIKIADCYYEQGQYLSSAKAYEDFAKYHPTNPASDYAVLRQGESLLKAYGGTGRDPSPLEEADRALVSFLYRYPQSIYRLQAQSLLAEVKSSLAEHHLVIADYYTARGNASAAAARAEEATLIKATSVPPVQGECRLF